MIRVRIGSIKAAGESIPELEINFNQLRNGTRYQSPGGSMSIYKDQTLISVAPSAPAPPAAPKKNRLWLVIGCAVLFVGCLVCAVVAAVLLSGADLSSPQPWTSFEVGESGGIVELDGLRIDFGFQKF
jgi:hypothetical protein